MVNLTPLSDAEAHNVRSLTTLRRAIEFSQGQFSLVLVRCNYAALQWRIVKQLKDLFPGDLPPMGELVVPPSVRTLYSMMQEVVGKTELSTVMVTGLESAIAIDDLLASTNNIRDEFRKHCPLPMVWWIDDKLLHKLWRLAPDFASWAATPIKFEMATEELLKFLSLETEYLFTSILNADSCPLPQNCSVGFVRIRHRRELEFALHDLQSRDIPLSPELAASVEFILGRDEYAGDRIDAALAHYHQSLQFWQASDNLERQGVLLFHIGLCYCRKADLHLGDNHHYWQQAHPYLEDCILLFLQANREDLAAQFISQLAEVLQQLEAWDALQTIAEKAVWLHKTYSSPVQLAQDYGFLAEVAVQQSHWQEGSQWAEAALAILGTLKDNQGHSQRFAPLLLAQHYRLLLAKSQGHLLKEKDANFHLEQAANALKPALESSEILYPQGYIRRLKLLNTLYFEQGYYREAFLIKLKRHSLEQQYRFRAFIGADRLHPQRQAHNPALEPSLPQHDTVALEIVASGRHKDIDQLMGRMTRPDCKLTVIHGQSGVGKSSTIAAGLVPALQTQALGDRLGVPVVLRVYTDWVRELGHSLAESLNQTSDFSINIDPDSLDSEAAILDQLAVNAHKNLITVLIFDQLEEIFLRLLNGFQQDQFDAFLSRCLDIPYVKIVLCLREDCLYWALKLKHLNESEIIQNNILDAHIRYSFTNFSTGEAKSIVEALTERSQFHLEPELIEALVQDLAGNEGEVRPIELQVVGAQLQAETITKLEQYQHYGPKDKLIERYLKEVIKDCGPENEQAAQLVLYLLTDENKTRPFKTRAELSSELAEFDKAEQLDLILDILVKSGLVVLFPEVPAARYQLVHDYLVDFIRYFQQHESGLQAQLHLLRQKARERLSEIEHLRSQLQHQALQAELAELPFQEGLTLLEELKVLRKQEALTHQEIQRLQAELNQKELQAQLAESREKQRRSEVQINRLLKRALGGLIFTTLILTGLSITAFNQKQEAVLKAIEAYTKSSEAFFASNREIDALIEGLKAGQRVKQAKLESTKNQSQMEVLKALQQAVYWGRQKNQLQGHRAEVASAIFSPDRQLIASSSADYSIKIWSVEGLLLHTLKGHRDRVNSISFSPDSELIASASSDKMIKLWDRNGQLIHTLEGHSDRVNSITFSPDGELIASGSNDQTIKLWRRDGTLVQTITAETDQIFSLAFSPDGTQIAAASRDQTVKIWRRDGTLVRTLAGHNHVVLGVAWSPDGQTIASASRDQTINLWRSDGTLLRTLTGHSEPVTSVTFSPDSQTVASTSFDNTIKLWHLDGTLLTTLKGHTDSVYSVNFSPDGQTIASASRDKTILLWYQNYPELTTLKRHRDWVTSVAFSPDDELIATASLDKTIRLWRRDGTLLRVLEGHTAEVWAVSFSPDGQFLASASADKTVILWNLRGTDRKILTDHTDTVFGVSWSPDGRQIASVGGGKDKTIKIWKRNGELVTSVLAHTSSVNAVAFSPDGALIASASDDNQVKLWDAEGTLLHTLEGHTEEVWDVTFSPDGQTIASASIDSQAIFWDRQGNRLHQISGEGDWFARLSYSPDGQLMASTMDNQMVKLWYSNGDKYFVLNAPNHRLIGVAFSGDSQTIAAGSADGTVILWDLADLDLDTLLERGCIRLQDYFQTNLQVKPSDREICQGNY